MNADITAAWSPSQFDLGVNPAALSSPSRSRKKPSPKRRGGHIKPELLNHGAQGAMTFQVASSAKLVAASLGRGPPFSASQPSAAKWRR